MDVIAIEVHSMFLSQRRVGQVCVTLAGIIFLAETLYGCIAVLGIGYDTVQEIVLDLCLTMSFPIFIIYFFNRPLAVVLLWVFFAIQWMDMDMDLLSRPRLLNPLNDWHSDLLFAGISVLTTAYIINRRSYADAVF
jgi:hypothetical protein